MKLLAINYDNDSHISWFPTGLAYVISALEQKGVQVDVADHAVSHLPFHYKRGRYDAVALSACGGYWQYARAKEIIEAVRREDAYIPILCGGHLFAPDPEYFVRRWGVSVCLGDGERLYPWLSSKRKILELGAGDVDDYPIPAYHRFSIDHYCLFRFHEHMQRADRALPMISSRGCKFKCNFCYRMDKGMRLRSPQAVVQEIHHLIRAYHINYISFADELFMASEDRADEMSEALMPLGIRWDCMGRLNYASKKILEKMKRAGCTFINYGIEQFDNNALKAMNKALTEDIIVRGVEATIKAGISPGLNMIWGNKGDTQESLEKSVEFLLKYDTQVQLRTIRPVTPYPGSPLFYEALETGCIEGVEDFYERKHLNSDLFTCNFTPYTEELCYELLRYANSRLTINYYDHLKQKTLLQIYDLYGKRDSTFRGFRPV